MRPWTDCYHNRWLEPFPIPADEAIAGAKITAVDTATSDSYSVLTNQDGNYRIDFVRRNLRRFRRFPGFAAVKHLGSIVTINQIVRNDFSLKPGSVQESITVEATSTMIKTDDDATVSATLTSKQISISR